MDWHGSWLLPVLLCLFSLLAGGCAHSYQNIDAEALSYTAQEQSDSVWISYRTDALLAAENDDFSEKAREKNVVPVAVRVENNRSTPITIERRTLRVRSGGVERSFLSPGITADMLGQAYGWHAFWGLLNVYYISADGEHVTYLPVGPVIGLINMIWGASANSSMKDDFQKQHLLGATLEPNTVEKGLVFIGGARGQPLSFEYRPPER